ncbi:hypothetical protein L211DRAFT_854147 [Terfezia boudieri ATCC MYA-4762]|uniref:Uncharacterized protein n=1 Tax=Terfezia boudieri ATCC MYA-4762 TaxID=1051890 RepID=A0A3N4L6C1_9PEZI|nr:hypothetical protein L211DRAFT_854147 [Terfezia boudieri ATCC MYA-4762]
MSLATSSTLSTKDSTPATLPKIRPGLRNKQMEDTPQSTPPSLQGQKRKRWVPTDEGADDADEGQISSDDRDPDGDHDRDNEAKGDSEDSTQSRESNIYATCTLTHSIYLF